jgi:hypothetical protein
LPKKQRACPFLMFTVCYGSHPNNEPFFL